MADVKLLSKLFTLVKYLNIIFYLIKYLIKYFDVS